MKFKHWALALIAALLLVLVAAPSTAQGRNASVPLEAADCSAETNHADGSLCLDTATFANPQLVICQTADGNCDTPGEWIATTITGATVSPSTAVSPASDDLVGAVGISADYARGDHKHPVQTGANTPFNAGATGMAAGNVDAAIAENDGRLDTLELIFPVQAAPPGTPVLGSPTTGFYFDSDGGNPLCVYNGTGWTTVGAGICA